MEEPEGSSSVLDSQADALIQRVAQYISEESGLGSVSSTIYDSAWVSMISKVVDGERKWLFPECFQFVLDANLQDVSHGPHGSDISDILNALAALLSLKTHYNAAQDNEYKEDNYLPVDLWPRMGKLVSFLEAKLRDWKVESCQYGGFEILVPALLAMLEKEGIYFQFQGRKTLFSLRQKKFARFDVRSLYEHETTPMIHSLEAFVEVVDFDKLSPHLHCGSMMSSPSSTAAYLINASIWDNEAEVYIRNLIAQAHGGGSGGVPHFFPMTIFELAWVTSTLLESGYSAESLGLENVEEIANYLEALLQTGKGIIGFAPSAPADADDTAKVISTLRLLGRPTVMDQMIEEFETNDHFLTFKTERLLSFSANCNVLNALLHQEEPGKYLSQLTKVTSFLCNAYWNGSFGDKWNNSAHYSMMLLAQALNHLLNLWDGDYLPDFPNSLLRHRIPVVMCQVLVRTLRSQTSNGSWENSSEVTSYAILTLISTVHLPWNELLEPQINRAIQRGREFLDGSRQSWKLPDYIWTAKVTYGIASICEAYCLAAMKAPATSRNKWSHRMLSLTKIPTNSVIKIYRILSNIPMLSKESGWRLKASIIEHFLFLPQLRSARGSVLRHNELKESRYVDYIGCIWTCARNLDNSFIDSQILWEMMWFVLLVYEIDEYVESDFTVRLIDSSDSIKQGINRLFRNYDSVGVKPSSIGAEKNDAGTSEDEDEDECFSRVVPLFLAHPQVQKAHPSDQRLLAQELQTYLFSIVDQSINSLRFSHQQKSGKVNTGHTVAPDNPPVTYSTWVHTAGASNLGGPMTFAFMACLLSSQNGGKSCFLGAQQKYLAQEVCRHSSILGRQLNDLGSVARDRDEHNLNSVNFPEFHEDVTLDEAVDHEKREMEIRNSLLQLAEYERELVKTAMARLEGLLETKTWKALCCFVNVTDLFGQLYIQRDLMEYVKKRG